MHAMKMKQKKTAGLILSSYCKHLLHEGKLNLENLLQIHSVLKLFTGFATAAFIA